MSVGNVGGGKQATAEAPKVLPQDVEKVVGKIRLTVVDVFANIQAFFRTLFYGSLNSWKEFWQNVGKTKYEISYNKKIELYRHYKRLELHEKALEKVKLLLKQIENTNSEDYYAVLVSLKELTNNLPVPKEIRYLINSKLQQVAQSSQMPVQYLPEKPEYIRPMWQKVAIGTLVLAGMAVAGYGAYSLYCSHQASQAAREEAIRKAARAAHNPKIFKGPVSSPDTPEGKAALEKYLAEKAAKEAQEAAARQEAIKKAARAAHNPKIFKGPVSSPDTPEGKAALEKYLVEKAAKEAQEAARKAKEGTTTAEGEGTTPNRGSFEWFWKPNEETSAQARDASQRAGRCFRKGLQ